MKHLLDQLNKHVHTLLIDKIESIDSLSHIIAIKNISLSDPLFQSISSVESAELPSQMLMNAHIQTGLLLLIHDNYLADHTFELQQVLSFTPTEPIIAGDQVRIETELSQNSDDIVTFTSNSFVDGQPRSNISFTIRKTNATTSGTFIHPTASVHSSAMLGHNVHIGPYAIINDQVTIGDNTTISAHVMVDKWTTIGSGNSIHYGAVIGAPAQDIKYKGEEAFVKIGDNNHIREYVTINRATGKDESTILGSNNMLLTNTHIGHNCVIGSNVTMANMVHIAGHVVVEDDATIGGLTGIYQHVRVGKGSMIGGYSRLIQDIPPFMLCDGNPAFVRNLNIVGCRRRGIVKDTIADLKTLYKLLYRSNLNVTQALSEYSPNQNSEEVQYILNFLQSDTSRGISKKSNVGSVDSDSE